MKNFNGVLSFARTSRQWPTLALLKLAGSPEKRAEALESVFLQAAEYSDDETALIHYGLILRNIEDRAAEAATQGKSENELLTRDEEAQMLKNGRRSQGLKTMDLYLKITGIKKNEFGKYLPDEKPALPKEVVRLFNTKKSMLEHIALRWRGTKDDAEAAQCFVFLWAAYELASCIEEKEICEKVIREATKRSGSSHFSPNRLVEHSLLLTSADAVISRHDQYYRREELGRILMHAWVNNSDPKDIAQLFRAMQPC